MIRKSKPIYYTNLDEISIWNWSQLQKTGDWQYIVKSGKADKHALKVYSDLLKQFENLNLPVLKAKKKVLISVIEIVLDIAQNSKEFEKLEKASKILRAIALTGENSDWLFKVDFTETSEQKSLLTRLAVAIKGHEELVENSKADADTKVQTLNEKVVAIEQILNIKIDPKETSVLLFATYEKTAIEKIRFIKRNK